VRLICPTHGRAGKMLVHKLLPDIALCVSESQAPLYKAAHPTSELVVHPDSIVGIGPKRQWIVDNVGACVQVDDDIVAISDVQAGVGEAIRVTDVKKIEAILERLMDMTEQMGIHVCGLSSYAHPAMYRPQNPFSLKQMIGSGVMGVRPSEKIVWPEKTDLLNDDLYISALAMHYDRMVLTDLRYAAVAAKTWTSTGGMQSMRTMNAMAEDEKYLKMVFGSDAIRRRQSTGLSTIKNEIQLQLVTW
jgi:hypothetical protein